MSHGTTSSESFSTLSEGLIHLQINAYDFYQEVPGDFDRHRGNSLPGAKYDAVPVIRIYGSLPTGHNVLCHIHGVFPYVFVPYDGREHDTLRTMNTRCSTLHTNLEEKLKATYARKPNDSPISNTDNSETLKYIADVSLVKAVNFYGYHSGYSAFYKISLLSQSFTGKLSDLLREGKATGRKCQVFEAHIPYLLQFSTDFNLFGCAWLKLEKCYFRTPLLNPDFAQDTLLMNNALEEFLARFYHGERNEAGGRSQRVGNSLLEIDIVPQFIKNRDEVTFKDFHSSVFERSQNQGKETLFIPSIKELWNQTSFLRKEFGLDVYEPIVEGERSDEPQKWQNRDENMLFFQKAKERMSLRNKLPRSDSSSRALEQIDFPNSALKSLWPSIESSEESYPNTSPVQLEIANSLPPSPCSSLDENPGSSVESDVVSNNEDPAELESNEQDHFQDSQNSRNSTNGRNQSPVLNLFSDRALTQVMMHKRSTNNDTHNIHLPVKVRKLTPGSLNISCLPNSYRYRDFQLSHTSILRDLENQGYPKTDYRDPYFTNPEDLKKKDYIYSGRKFNLKSTHLSCRRPVDFSGETIRLDSENYSELENTSWKYIPNPPNYASVKAYTMSRKRKFRSQIDFKTLSNEFGYKFKSNNSLKGMNAGDYNKLSHLTLEIFASTRGVLLSDPAKDPICLIFWKAEPDSFSIDIGLSAEGVMAFSLENDSQFASRLELAAKPTPVAVYRSEEDMISGLIDLVLLLDPDILSGFEVHSSAWGYLIERCDLAYDRDFCEEISRVKHKPQNKRKDVWGYSHDSGIHIAGRHVLNLWRLLKSGLNLLQYTVENITFHVLHERLAHFPPSVLTKLWESSSDITSLTTLISYWKKRTDVNIRLLQSQQSVNQIVEQARLIGIDFYSVISRGSQYKVESVMVRLCKSEHFLALSPSKMQVRKQKALECIPLVMEPESAFYKSPLVVLDFQSLYPSIMIGYNYCYSTILGRVQELKLRGSEIGASRINIPKGFVEQVENHLTISPNGTIFVKSDVRKSTLAKMLTDILDTRLLVKKTMSDLKSKNETISKLLNNKQVALKLLANVTYGYTSASFSGRMPCSDVADSIVQTGRETLQKAIALIEAKTEWGAKVVYGDTDSLFVYLPGKSREEALLYGKEMAGVITASNPFPVTLKFEKVYHPCLLVSKKRYVGYSYEKEEQKEPKFDAKGIETVRRDGHPAQQKIVEKSLRILFETKDLSAVKTYIQNQFQLITKGQVSIQDFCFARAVKLGSYKSEKTMPPGAVVATKKKELDHRAEPQHRERVPYVVIKGKPGQILRERCIPPEVFLSNDSFELDSTYYITKTLIPPLQRFFNLMGVDVAQWYNEMPRIQDLNYHQAKEGKLPDFMRSTLCFNCKKEIRERTESVLCAECLSQKSATAAELLTEDMEVKKHLKDVLAVCRSCCQPLTKNSQDDMSKVVTKCDSQDCPVYYSRIKYKGYTDTLKARQRNEILEQLDSW
ncbi:LANO_0H16226g1_1 [Lachancea nothofagi CBS 11611]|uniref:DNA polymerase n=1 Tax=Lachancea nothofagi CBS 11611 TaxID=1266666 RepID=A0A1G4KMR3_9SACH|nr:LANO_0H16226g1_1 [Lachancea nothofagi CBS 11611]